MTCPDVKRPRNLGHETRRTWFRKEARRDHPQVGGPGPRLTCVIPSLAPGGAERVLSILANHWVQQGREVTILTFDSGVIRPFFPVDARVRLVPLNLASSSPHLLAGLWSNLKRIMALRRAIRYSSADVVLSFMERTNVLVLLATRALRVAVVVAERTDPSMHRVGVVWALLRDWTYRLADRIVVQTERAQSYFSERLQRRMAVIPNPVLPLPREQAEVAAEPGKPSIVSMGRLSEEKQFDMLIRAFARLKDRYPDWTVTIIGDGPLRDRLEVLCRELSVSNRIALIGTVTDPYRYLRRASLFVLCSRFEGFPNSLCEAMACGLPVIATDCPSGPREIIHHGEDGLLVPPTDEEALVQAMDHLMGNETARKGLGARATGVVDRYELRKVMEMWEEALLVCA